VFFQMKQRVRTRPQFSSAVAVRLEGYGRVSHRRSAPWLRLGGVVLIAVAVAITMVFRHLSRGSEERTLLTAAPRGDISVSTLTPAPLLPLPESNSRISTALLPGPESTDPVPPPTVQTADATGKEASSPAPPSVTKAIKATRLPGPTPSPSSILSAPGHTAGVHGGTLRRYHVQAGDLPDRAAAEELARRLRVLGYAVRILGTHPFLVWVGGYLDEPTAGRLLSNLREQGFDAVLNSETPPSP
jgi:hypothetical protein